MRYKLRYHHSENQDIPRNLYKIAWGQFMEIWLQKFMTNTSLINVETLILKGVPGDIFKLRRVAQMRLVSQAKTRHVQNFWRSYPLEVSAISNRTVTIHSWSGETCPFSLLLWCWPHFREFLCALSKNLSISLKYAFKTEASLAQFAFYHLSARFYFHTNVSFLLRY